MTKYLLGGLAAAALALAGCNNRAGTGYSGYQHDNKAAPASGAGATAPGATEAGQNSASAVGTYGSASDSNPGQIGEILHATGTVKDSSSDSLTLVTPDQGQVKVNIGQQTTFVGPGGEQLSQQSIKQGAEVRAAYTFDGKQNQASQIVVTQMPAGSKQQAPSTPNQTGSPDQTGTQSQGQGSQNQ